MFQRASSMIRGLLGRQESRRPTEGEIDLRSVHYSMPTIAADEIALEAPMSDASEEAPQFHEDAWRQVEFLPKACQWDVQDMLGDYKQFEQENRTPNGWKKIFPRKLDPNAVVPMAALQLASLLGAKLGPPPILTTSSALLGQVRNGFSIPLGPSTLLYGHEEGGHVMVLGAIVSADDGQVPLTNAFMKLRREQGLILVDWRSQMLLLDVKEGGDIEAWGP